MFSFLKRFFDYNQRELRRLRQIVDQINALEPKIQKLSDKQLRKKTDEFRNKIADGVAPATLLPEAFAVVREAARRTIGLRHFDVQMMAAICLWEGKIAEQKTGEGKTLSATPALYLRALEGKGAHLVTVNDYLARRDCGWMGPIFDFLGLKVGCIIPYQAFVYDPTYTTETEDERLAHLRPVPRRVAYEADITYGTNSEFGFDYLRDNMADSLADVVQRGHFFAIVDEVDFALIDEARTPLIISAPFEESTEKYHHFAQLARKLQPEIDYTVDEKEKAVMLTEWGIRKVERMLGVNNLYEQDFDTIRHIENALKAQVLFQRDRDYVVKDNEVVIVDEFTGRLMYGRRWSDGLHQAIEAKEGVPIQQESKTLATITLQNYFRMYQVLSGMTGTAATEAEEFKKIYNLDVVVIPTHKPMIRKDYPDLVYKTQRAKWAAVVEEIEKCYRKGQPVLVGTTSIEKNEMLSRFLKKKGIPHQVLNAKHHEREAGIIAQAGRLKAVTVATNMAGRGVDIILGGTPPKEKKGEAWERWKKEHDQVVALGGLHVIGTERHEARRIDNQLRGRAGRQGDPGSSRFYVALDDDLMRIFGGDKIAEFMEKFNFPENTPISHPMISRLIEQIQIKVEGFHFDIRKSLVEFDDVVNKQREIIYKKRRQILEWAHKDKNALKKHTLDVLFSQLDHIIATSETAKETAAKFAELVGIDEVSWREELVGRLENSQKPKEILREQLQKFFQKREELLGEVNAREIEKSLWLYTSDSLWIDHLTALEHLKEGVRLRGLGQRDPLVEYRKEGYQMFQELLAKVAYYFARRLFRVSVQPQHVALNSQQTLHPQFKNQNESQTTTMVNKKPGRNDPCPCGSGKKYKKCCYPKFG